MTIAETNAIANVLAGDFATANAVEKGKVWVIVLSLADVCGKHCAEFVRSDFYAAVFGTSDHFPGARQNRRC